MDNVSSSSFCGFRFPLVAAKDENIWWVFADDGEPLVRCDDDMTLAKLLVFCCNSVWQTALACNEGMGINR